MGSLKQITNTLLASVRVFAVMKSSKFERNRLLGEITRNTHSIEKGLSLDNIRKGFGVKKIKEANYLIFRYIDLCKKQNTPQSLEAILMFVSAVHSYLAYHESIGYCGKEIEEVKLIYEKLLSINGIDKQSLKLGGTINVVRNNFTSLESEVIGRLFEGRHSVRSFSKTPVSEDDLRKAIELALHCPSACNRQCHRVYVVERKVLKTLSYSLDGIGGFTDDLDKILFITGRISDYRISEFNQWVVTGSIFAAYLSLALESRNIGCCFVQRPLLPNKKWEKLKLEMDVPADEQLICCLGIGNYKSEFKAPISHRYSYDSMVKIVNPKL